jgi:hypothetical protein
LNAQLQEIRSDLESASGRLKRLAARLDRQAWTTRPPGGGWSPAECVAHLNRTGEEFLPLMREALRAAPALPAGSNRRLRRNFSGWLLWRIMPPPVRFSRTRAIPALLPPAEPDPPSLLTDFSRLQQDHFELLEDTPGRAIDQVYITSPVNQRMRYNLFACLGILARHQHRHLWQAEHAAAAARRAETRG